MVGAFGEVQVMDWGLAKRLIEGQQPDGGLREQLDPGSKKPAAGGSTANVAGSLDETIESPTPASDTGFRSDLGS